MSRVESRGSFVKIHFICCQILKVFLITSGICVYSPRRCAPRDRNKSHIPSLPQNNLYIFGKLGGKFETKFVTIFPRYLPLFYIDTDIFPTRATITI